MQGKIDKYREAVEGRKKVQHWTDGATKDFTWEQPVGYRLAKTSVQRVKKSKQN